MPAPASREGTRVPRTSFRLRRDNEWRTVTTDELFGGRRVVVFSLPGAFTPTCSSMHVPRYNELAPVFFRNGIDAILCIAVNDPFVMEQWAHEQECGNVTMIPDGNGSFTEAMGMMVDKSDLNFGRRSWRYSMLVDDGRIEKMFIEPAEPGDPYEVSDADTMLAYVAPQARKPDEIAIFTREGCPYCAAAKRMLDEAGCEYAEVPLPHRVRPRVLAAIASASTVPQVFVNGRLVGGSEELRKYLDGRRSAQQARREPQSA